MQGSFSDTLNAQIFTHIHSHTPKSPTIYPSQGQLHDPIIRDEAGTAQMLGINYSLIDNGFVFDFKLLSLLIRLPRCQPGKNTAFPFDIISVSVRQENIYSRRIEHVTGFAFYILPMTMDGVCLERALISEKVQMKSFWDFVCR